MSMVEWWSAGIVSCLRRSPPSFQACLECLACLCAILPHGSLASSAALLPIITGFPSGGNDYASLNRAQVYFNSLKPVAMYTNTLIYHFSAFDEPNKGAAAGDPTEYSYGEQPLQTLNLFPTKKGCRANQRLCQLLYVGWWCWSTFSAQLLPRFTLVLPTRTCPSTPPCRLTLLRMPPACVAAGVMDWTGAPKWAPLNIAT